MTMVEQTFSAETQPAPHRQNASLLALWFGLTSAPLAWSAQSIIGYTLASFACFPGSEPRATPLFAGTRQILFALNVAAIILAVMGATVAYRSWSATWDERGGGSRRLVEVGEGRTRFLAMCGLLASVGFLIATIFSSFAIIVVPLCR